MASAAEFVRAAEQLTLMTQVAAPKSPDELMRLIGLNYKDLVLDSIRDDTDASVFLLACAGGAAWAEGAEGASVYLRRVARRLDRSRRLPWWQRIFRRRIR